MVRRSELHQISTTLGILFLCQLRPYNKATEELYHRVEGRSRLSRRILRGIKRSTRYYNSEKMSKTPYILTTGMCTME